jgi:hypothetical protein
MGRECSWAQASPGVAATPSADFVIDPRMSLAKFGLEIHLLKV